MGDSEHPVMKTVKSHCLNLWSLVGGKNSDNKDDDEIFRHFEFKIC